jgi:hypothetical protein
VIDSRDRSATSATQEDDVLAADGERRAQERANRTRADDDDHPAAVGLVAPERAVVRAHRRHTPRPGSLPDVTCRPVAAAICHRQVSESQAAWLAPLARIFSNSGSPTAHPDLVFLPLQAIRAGDPATVVVHVDRPEPGDEREQVERREADAVAAELARPMVWEGLPELAEAGVESTPCSWRSSRNSQMSHVASATAVASSSSRSSISRYSALSVWVHDVDVPTMRYPARA